MMLSSSTQSVAAMLGLFAVLTHASPAPQRPEDSCPGSFYTTQPGDTCSSLTQSSNVTAQTITQANPESPGLFANCSNVPVGVTICIPKYNACSGPQYTVAFGDSCSSIANHAHVTRDALVQFNHIPDNCNELPIGLTICIPPSTNAAASSNLSARDSSCSYSENPYIVQPGDSCNNIALTTNTTTAALEARNGIQDDCRDLQVGQVLCIPNSCKVVEVKSGDTCSRIASANNITLPQFYAFNPNVDPTCSNLLASTNACISATPSNATGSPFANGTVNGNC